METKIHSVSHLKNNNKYKAPINVKPNDSQKAP